MSRTAIVTDSTAYLPRDLVDLYNISVLPLDVIFPDRTYLDGVDITPAEFYEKQRDSAELPTTSQPSAGNFEELYRELIAAGAEEIICILISAALSGTVNSAEIARAAVSEVPIHIIDSKFTSMAQGFLVLEAARAVEAGVPTPKVVELVTGLIPRMNLIFVVDTLKYLHKGGRIGGAAALFGTALDIKPLLYINDGRVDTLEKIRTKKKAQARLVDIIAEQAAGKKLHCTIIHATARAEAEELLAQVAARCDCVETYISEVSPVIGTHTGPGAVGACFYTE